MTTAMGERTIKRPPPKLPSLWKIVEHWSSQEDNFCVEPEWPRCYACLRRVSGRERWDNPADRWDTSGQWLERGHLVNRARGGSDGVENLVPLCHLCNHTMPTFTSMEPPGPIDWILDGGFLQYTEITENGLILHKRPSFMRKIAPADNPVPGVSR